MNKGLLILYLIIFGCYQVWSRQPDYFDGEKYPATIQMVMDSATGKMMPIAFYSIGTKPYSTKAAYVLQQYKPGEKVTIIVEHEHPERAAVYRFWGYWITWEELLASVVIAVLLFQVAVSITSNPTPEAVREQMDYKPEKKTKYIP
ncbi:MAG: hypothetical protein I8H66_08155 [Sphingobacteriia bacterium]|nr:hypothetical protein [Sphingobacteriia bacterium]